MTSNMEPVTDRPVDVRSLRTVTRGLLSTLQCFQDSDRTNSGKSGYVPVINLLVIVMPLASVTTPVSGREAL